MMGKQQVNRYVSHLYRFLEKDTVRIEFKKLKVNRGYLMEFMSGRHVVQLDHRDQIVGTLIHEFLHYKHPDWSEEKVLNTESLILNALTPLQIKNIIKRFAESL